MAYLYSDFESQTSTAAKITQLQLHMAEVEAQIGADVSADGKSRSTATLEAKMDRLTKRLVQLQGMPDAGGAVNGGLSRARFIRGNQ